jgi:hypothetical protein
MIEAELPDGTVLEFPPGTSQDVIQRAVRQRMGVPAPQAPQPERGGFLQTVGDIGAGAVRGAGSIGATLLAPVDVAKDLYAGRGLSLQSNRERRQAMDEGLRSLGANPDSFAYQAGKIGGEIAGTMGAPGVLARGAQAVGAAPVLVNALRSAGMSAGGATGAKALGTRVLAGAATGATAAGMVNPEEAGTGALIGGALPLATTAAKGAVAAGRKMIGTTTGVGDDALRVAYESGKAGGPQAQALRENMRGQANMLDVLDDARANLETMRQTKAAAYRQNMASVKADKSVLDLAPIEQSVQDSINKFTFKGQARNPQVVKALQQASDEVSAWRQLDPAEFHTPEGVDALKQRLGSIRESVPFEARDVRAALDNVYNSAKRQIEAQAPEYSKAMREYAQASQLVDEINRALSLNNRATADTAMRKLQSVMRNNVNTNYGLRQGAVEALEQQGGRQLMPALAGQALNDWVPRGIQRATGPGLSLGAGLAGGLPAAAGTAALSSPRLMGEASYLTGVAARNADPLIQALRRGMYSAAPVIGAQ